VLLDSETVWDDVRREVVERAGRTWKADATRAMMGMSSPEWAAYLQDELGVPVPASEISAAVVAGVIERYQRELPLLPGAREAVVRISTRWPLGLASSSNRPVIDRVLDASGLRDRFAVTVSSEEVAHGKPAPDVYLAAVDRLGTTAERCVAIEDSSNGIRSAATAGPSALPGSTGPRDRMRTSLHASRRMTRWQLRWIRPPNDDSSGSPSPASC
jgi:HAD superfamily hydrolase (TIGR01509 family)